MECDAARLVLGNSMAPKVALPPAVNRHPSRGGGAPATIKPNWLPRRNSPRTTSPLAPLGIPTGNARRKPGTFRLDRLQANQVLPENSAGCGELFPGNIVACRFPGWPRSTDNFLRSAFPAGPPISNGVFPPADEHFVTRPTTARKPIRALDHCFLLRLPRLSLRGVPRNARCCILKACFPPVFPSRT